MNHNANACTEKTKKLDTYSFGARAGAGELRIHVIEYIRDTNMSTQTQTLTHATNNTISHLYALDSISNGIKRKRTENSSDIGTNWNNKKKILDSKSSETKTIYDTHTHTLCVCVCVYINFSLALDRSFVRNSLSTHCTALMR